MRVLKTVSGAVLEVAFSPDCRAVAAAVHGAGIFLWNLDSPNISPVRLEVTGGYYPGGLNFSADGRQLAWLTLDSRRTYDRDTRTATDAVYPGTVAPSLDHCSDTAGMRAVTNHRFPENSLIGWKWSGEEWVRQWQLSTRDLFVGSLTMAPTGDRFAMFTRAAKEGRWWDQPMRLEVRDPANSDTSAVGTYPYSYSAEPLQFHPHGAQIAGLNNMTLLVWSLPEGGDPRLVQNDSRKHFTSLAYHPSGRLLFVSSNDKSVHVFDAHTLDRVNRYTWQLEELGAVAVSADGTLAAAGSSNGDVVVWDLD